MTVSNPKVLVREPPEFPRIEDFHRTKAMTTVTLRTHGPRGFTDRKVAVPSHLPEVVRVEERLYVVDNGRWGDGKWHEANVWPIFEEA